MNSRQKGNVGEEKAVRYLTAKGYRIEDRQFRSPWGEIDIIAGDGEEIVFVEVKAWRTWDLEEMAYAVGPEKQRRIRQTSRYWMVKRGVEDDRPVRYDVVFLSGRTGELHHFEDAF